MSGNNLSEDRVRFFGIGKVLKYTAKYRKLMFVMLLFALIGTAFDVAVPIFRKYALNHFVTLGTLDTLPFYIVIYVSAILFAAYMNYVSCYLAIRVEVSVNKELRNTAFRHLQELSFSYFNQNSVGYIHARVMSDCERIGELFSWTMIECVWHCSYLVGAVAVMLFVNAKLALLVISVMPVIAIVFSFFQKKLISINRTIREKNARITSDINEGITGAKTIKSLVIEDPMCDKFRNDTTDMRMTSIRGARLRGLFSSTLTFASSLVLAVVLWRGGILAKEDIGTFSLFMSYAEGIMEPIRWVVESISNIIMTQVNIERVTKLIETEPNVTDTKAVISVYGDSFEPLRDNWEQIQGDIKFEDVSFRYPDGDEYVLEHFDLDIPFGTSLAIVGETGAGKSTLINLVCRFFEPTSGRILLDGKDLRERSQLWLHSSIGYVLQTPHLFSGTIKENLLYGNPNATDEQIREAISLVSADSVIEHLENGIDTDVGEGGDLLSTGEKQLISFARAILSDPKIMILDEATSSIDTLTEKKIQDALKSVISGRTSIIVAHRLSTIKDSDIILAVKGGKIVEKGTHQELMRAKGYYYGLYTRQYEDEATTEVLK